MSIFVLLCKNAYFDGCCVYFMYAVRDVSGYLLKHQQQTIQKGFRKILLKDEGLTKKSGSSEINNDKK